MTTMMRAGLDLLPTIASADVLRFGVAAALKASILLAVAAFATLVLTRRAAALRHFVWTLAIAGALALPFVAGTLPWSWRVLPAPAQDGAVPSLAEAAPAASAHESLGAGGDTETSTVPSVTRSTATPAAPAVASDASKSGASLPLGWIGLALWALVADALLLHLVAGRVALALLARRATPVLDMAHLEELELGLRAAGLRRDVRLLWSARARVPMTWGLRRPVVLLPEEARTWSRARIRLVLQHELAHVRRLDDLTHLIARLACAVHWFNPLVWWAASRLRDESELACDDQVLRTGARASDYAGHLLELVSTLGAYRAPAGALPLAQRSSFEGRLLAILDPARQRSGLARGGAAGLVVVTGAVVTLLGAVAPARADASSPGAQAPDVAPVVEAPAVVDVAPPPATADVPAEAAAPATQAEPDAAALAAMDSTSVRALMRALTQDEDERVRRAAAWALGQLEDRTATDALATALTGDTSIEVRRTAAWALGQLEDAGSVDALGAALSDEDGEVRSTALWALGQIESPDAIPALTRALSDTDTDARKQAAWALGQIESPESVAPLSSLVDDPDEEVRAQAVWALGQIESPEAVTPLSRALSDDSPDVRKQAAWALGQIESPDALTALSNALSDTNGEVAATAAWAIGQIEPSSAPPALLDAVRSGSGELRANALWALVQIEDPAAVPVLVDALQDDNPGVRAAALRGLAEIRDESAIRAITELLDDPDPEVRAAAVRALAGRGGGWGGPRPRPQPRPRPRPRPNGR